jgi:hypothetical protein
LREEVREQTERADLAEREAQGYVRNPLRLFARIASTVWRRLRGS